MDGFRIVGEISAAETMAEGASIRDLLRLTKMYGRGHWRKRKGGAIVVLDSGELRHVEVHWYEAHGFGRKELKIKRYLD